MTFDLTDPTTTALLASRALSEAGIAHALYGGLVLAAYGVPRETRDADLAVLDASGPQALAALARAGADVRLSFEGVRFGGLVLTRLALIGGQGFVGLNTVDLVRPLSDRLARAVLARAAEAPLRDQLVRVVSLEDFVLLKALSTREQDVEDAASVIRRNADVLDDDLLGREVGLLEVEVPDADVDARYRRIRTRAAALA